MCPTYTPHQLRYLDTCIITVIIFHHDYSDLPYDQWLQARFKRLQVRLSDVYAAYPSLRKRVASYGGLGKLWTACHECPGKGFKAIGHCLWGPLGREVEAGACGDDRRATQG